MSTVENQNDFTSWKQKDTHRPVLRLPLNSTSTTPFVSASTNALPAHKKESEGKDDVHSDLSSSSSAVSPLPIPSVKNGSQQTSADAAHHAGHTQKHSGTVPDPTCAVPHPLQTLSRDMASSGSHSFPASDQLLKEKARLLEEEHESLRMSMSEKMQRHGDASHSASALVTAEVAPSAPAAAAAPSSPSGSSAATPSSFSRDSRGSLTSSTKSSTAVVLECGDGGDGDGGVEVSKRAVVTQAAQHRTKDAAAASSVDSASHSLKRTQQSNESDNTRASKASLLRFSSAAASSSSSATSSPLDVRQRQDAARRDGHAAQQQQQQQPSPSPSPRARRIVVSPSPESSTPAPGDAQPESSSSASASAATHALSMEHLRHDVQRCANEIERLVEDQYDLRCSVREALMELSGLVATLRSCAGGPAESFTTTTAAADDDTDDDGHHSRSAAAPNRREAQTGAAQNKGNDKENIGGGVSLSVSPPASQQQQSCDGQHSPAPPAWLLPWLEQLRQEQQTHFQHMKEEMVVLICHAVASAHDGQAYRAASSSEQQQQQRPSLSTAGATTQGEWGMGAASAVDAISHVAATRERGRGAVVAAARNGYSLQEVGEDEDKDHHQQQQQPPSSLLWQRYRRLLSPTPPNRSERAASSSSTVASEPSVMSLRGQDALWSALLRVQQLVDGQSTQMAQLAERLSVPPPPQQQQQYEQAFTAGNREAVEETAYAATKVPRKKAEKAERHRHEVESVATSRLDSTSTRASERDESISSSFSSSPPPRRHQSRHRETVKTAKHKSRSNSSSNNNTTRARTANAVKRKEASTPAEKPSQLDALQDDVSALKQMLRETLARDRYLHEQEERQEQQQQRKTNDRLSSSRTPDDTAVTPRYEGSRSSDADTRASTYAQRHYVPAPTVPPPPPLPSQQPQQQQRQTTSRLPPAQDTRYAPGVAPPHHLQRQPVDEAFRTPVQRSTRQPVNGPPPLSSQSPYASSPIPYDEWVSEEDVYSEGTGSRRGESRSEGWDRAAGAGAAPQERPRQRVRTVLTSSLVYPH